MSRGKVSLVEQDTIDYVSTAYFEPKKSKGYVMLFSADATIFKKNGPENMKIPPSKVARNQPNFFFSTDNWPKTSPNLSFCSIKIAHRSTYV